MTSNHPKVSIIVPLYNQERYLNPCLRSICKQSYQNLEIIVVNDGSTDCSLEILLKLAKKDTRIKVIDKKNEGAIQARLDGLKGATGDYVSFVDSDDLLPIHAIDVMAKVAVEKNVDMVMGNHDRIVGPITTHRKVSKGLFPANRLIMQPELFEKYYVNFFCPGRMFDVGMWAKLYRRDAIERAQQATELFSPEVNLMKEDLFFNMKLFPYLRSAYLIDESVYKYRYGGGTFGFNKNMPQVLTLCDKRLELLDQFNYTKGYAPLFSEYVAFVYNHASQLIYFNKADQDGVISFFKQELASRQLVPRLEAFYETEKNLSDGHRFLLNRDYEAMYEKAKALGQATYGNMKFKIINTLVSFFEGIA